MNKEYITEQKGKQSVQNVIYRRASVGNQKMEVKWQNNLNDVR